MDRKITDSGCRRNKIGKYNDRDPTTQSIIWMKTEGHIYLVFEMWTFQNTLESVESSPVNKGRLMSITPEAGREVLLLLDIVFSISTICDNEILCRKWREGRICYTFIFFQEKKIYIIFRNIIYLLPSPVKDPAGSNQSC